MPDILDQFLEDAKELQYSYISIVRNAVSCRDSSRAIP